MPEGLHVITHLEIRWSISPNCETVRRQNGSYEFWFLGKLSLAGLVFNLFPHHASHKTPENTEEPWPIFPGLTKPERKGQRDDHMYNSCNTKASCGELEILIEYRGYKAKPTDAFKKPLGNGVEMTGPTEVPMLFDDSIYFIPNRIRFGGGKPREKLPWLDNEPAFWSVADPHWTHQTVAKIRWGGEWTSGGNFGDFSLTNGPGPAATGNLLNPQ